MFTKKSAICTNYVHLRLFKFQFFGSMNRNRDFKNIDGLVPAGLLSIKSPLAVFFGKFRLAGISQQVLMRAKTLPNRRGNFGTGGGSG